MGWPFSVKKYFENIDLFELFLSKQSQNRASVKTFCRENIFFIKLLFIICKAKLRTYSSIKTKIVMEDDLTNIHNTTDRVSVSTFRLSNHLMAIEVGRYKKMERHDRKCPFCPYEVEDEIHFFNYMYNILICPKTCPLKMSLQIQIELHYLKF